MAVKGPFLLAEVHSETLYQTGHMANRWFSVLSERLGASVRMAAPYRAGALKEGIGADMHRTGRETMTAELWSEADHTMYVLRGTTGPIMARRLWASGGDPSNAYVVLWGSMIQTPGGKKFSRFTPKGTKRSRYKVAKTGYFMKVRPMPHSRYSRTTKRVTVNGQEAQNFLLEGWRHTAHNHRAMAHIPSFVRNP